MRRVTNSGMWKGKIKTHHSQTSFNDLVHDAACMREKAIQRSKNLKTRVALVWLFRTSYPYFKLGLDSKGS